MPKINATVTRAVYCAFIFGTISLAQRVNTALLTNAVLSQQMITRVERA